MVMRPRHALTAAAFLGAVTRGPDVTKPDVPGPRACPDGPAERPRRLGQLSRIASSSALQILVGASVGHAEGFDCQRTDRRGRRLLTLWGIGRAQDHPDGRPTYGWTRTSYRWAAGSLVHPAGTTSGTFVAAPDDPPPAEFTTRCGAGSW